MRLSPQRAPAIPLVRHEWRLNRRCLFSLILFQDDDFLAGGRESLGWAKTIAREAIRRGLHERMRFRFACRSDEGPNDGSALAAAFLTVKTGFERARIRCWIADVAQRVGGEDASSLLDIVEECRDPFHLIGHLPFAQSPDGFARCLLVVEEMQNQRRRP